MSESKPLRKRLCNSGLLAFFFSGMCAMATGVVVSLLQDMHGLSYSTTGTLLATMNVGNLLSGFAAGILPGKIGLKKSVALLTFGYAIGYTLMGFTGLVTLLMLCFFLLGVAKGATLNTCTILVGDNSENRTVGMNLMHACYALGALLSPFAIALSSRISPIAPLFVLAVMGAGLWLVFFQTPLNGKGSAHGRATDWSFLHRQRFWLLTGLLFCQNAAETSVTSWMVTYFKGSGLISGTLSAYMVTVMWLSTLIARMLIAFVFPLKKPAKAMMCMSAGCILFYALLMGADAQWSAVGLLFAFAFSMAGMNPTGVALAGRMSTVTSIGVMLPVASSGAILMPWVIGMVSEMVDIRMGMGMNIIPCVGMLLFSFLVSRLPMKENEE